MNPYSLSSPTRFLVCVALVACAACAEPAPGQEGDTTTGGSSGSSGTSTTTETTGTTGTTGTSDTSGTNNGTSGGTTGSTSGTSSTNNGTGGTTGTGTTGTTGTSDTGGTTGTTGTTGTSDTGGTGTTGTTGTTGGPECEADEACDDGSLCVDGACVPGDCRTDEECEDPGYRCEELTCTALVAPVVDDFRVEPQMVLEGGDVTVSWEVSDAAEVSVSADPIPAGWVDSSEVSGSAVIAASEDFTVFLSAINDVDSVSEERDVVVVPLLDVTNPAAEQAALPNGLVGEAYSVVFTAEGGLEPLVWTLDGALPTGLSFDVASATVSGTPTQAGVFPLTVRTQDNFDPAQSVERAVQLEITEVVTELVLADQTFARGDLNEPYTAIINVQGGRAPFSWSIVEGVLPAGLSLDQNGRVSGTPTAHGRFEVTIAVEDGSGQRAENAFVFIVNPPPVVVVEPNLPEGVVGVPFAASLSAEGGTAPFSWAVADGALPPGLALSAQGSLTGTPTQSGVWTVTVTVLDASDPIQTAERAIQITVQPAPLTADAPSIPDAIVQQPYTGNLTAQGGVPPYAWTATTPLPNGITLSGDGALSGTPTTVGSTTFTAQVSDASDPVQSAEVEVTFIVRPEELAVTTASLPNGAVNRAYTQTLAAQGGVGPYTWVITQGGLPAGLSLSTDGVISGTPTSEGAFTCTVQATDQEGATAVRALSITVDAPVLSFATTFLPEARVGEAYDVTVAVNGGVGPFVWELESGALPAGLSWSPENNQVRIQGTPTLEENASFAFRVEDSEGNFMSQGLSINVLPMLVTNPFGVRASSLIDISSTGTRLEGVSTTDDASEPVPVGFDFTFFGEVFSSMNVSSNGFISFSSTTTAFSNASIPSVNAPAHLVAAFWDDLNPASNGDVYVETRGVAPYRFCIVQWKDVATIGDTTARLNFEVVLYESTQEIQLLYGVSTSGTSSTVNRAFGASATAGIQNGDGTQGLEIATNTALSLLPGQFQVFVPQNASYVLEGFDVTPGGFEDISTTGTPLADLTGDDSRQMTEIGFGFDFYGQNYTNIYVSTNGFVSFQEITAGFWSNVNLPTADGPNAIIAPFWDDLKPYVSVSDEASTYGKVYVETRGEAPLRRWIVQWDGFRFVGESDAATASRLTFQAVLYETTNHIAFHYGVMRSANAGRVRGNSATVGIENADGTLATQVGASLEEEVRTGSSAYFLPPRTTDTSSYTPIAPSTHLRDIQATGTLLDISTQDDASVAVDIGFPFDFYGQSYTQVAVSTNGFVSFDTSIVPIGWPGNGTLPQAGTPNNIIAAFWDDLDPGEVEGRGLIFTQLLGTEPNREFVVHWVDVPRYLDTAQSTTFQVVLRESDGAVEVNYGPMLRGTGNGYLWDNATVGVENAEGSDAAQLSANQAGAAPSGGQVIFYPR